jgi:hypothetical protein
MRRYFEHILRRQEPREQKTASSLSLQAESRRDESAISIPIKSRLLNDQAGDTRRSATLGMPQVRRDAVLERFHFTLRHILSLRGSSSIRLV